MDVKFIKKILSFKDHPPIIIHGTNIENNIFNILNILIINKTFKDIVYIQYDNYYIFDIIIIKNDFIKYKEFIYDIIQSKSIIPYNIYLIFKNYHKCSYILQLYIKNIIEKKSYIKIILITNIYSSIIKSILYGSILLKYNYKNEIIIKNNKNISNYIYKLYTQNISYTKFVRYINELVYNILCCNLDLRDIYNEFISIILSKPYIVSSIKYKLLKSISNIEKKIHKSYNIMILYEYMFIKTYEIIKNSIDLYYY